jgi:hypothetical protein
MLCEKNELCNRFDTEIFLYIGHELDSRRAEQWTLHLNSCRKCSKKLREIKTPLSFYNQLPLDDVDDISFERILRRTRFFSIRSDGFWRAAALSVAAVLVITSTLLLKDTPPAVDVAWSVDQTELSIEEIDTILNDWTEQRGTGSGLSLESRDVIDVEIEDIEKDIEILEQTLDML